MRPSAGRYVEVEVLRGAETDRLGGPVRTRLPDSLLGGRLLYTDASRTVYIVSPSSATGSMSVSTPAPSVANAFSTS